ncbi:MAG: hypothetical protein LKF13_04815 [Atopobiaceae bacterium]|jgi:hypothetical protein|nr:hypothetical protein [Atopobiaceae bacterium]
MAELEFRKRRTAKIEFREAKVEFRGRNATKLELLEAELELLGRQDLPNSIWNLGAGKLELRVPKVEFR